MEGIKLGSLFDGIGGFPLAATMHGITPVWASEIEKFPIAVTSHRFPDMKHLGDIMNINGAEVEPVDIITFGSPCQDLSVAGKRDGLEGKRSNLFYQAVRIIREMREATNGVYPRFAIWENVPGAFSSAKGQDFRAVLEEIMESEIPMPDTGRWATAGMVRGSGRSAAWRVLDAQYWGVPQRRKRIFLVADFAGQRAGEILFEQQGVSGHIAESGEKGEEVATGVRDGFACTVRMREGCAGGGKGSLVSEDKSLTLGCSNDQTLIAGTVSAKWAKGTGGPAGDECQNLVAFGPGGQGDIAHALRAQPSKAAKPSSTTYAVGVIPINDKATRHKGGGSTRNSDGSGNGLGVGKPGDPCPTLTAGDKHAVASWSPKMWKGEQEMTNPLLATDYKDPQCVYSVDCRNLNENEELSGTLQSKENGGYSLNYQNPVRVGYTVRRLTPTECERLQGFPDNWTDIPGASDTGRYKALGNSVAVPCVSWIMGRVRLVI